MVVVNWLVVELGVDFAPVTELQGIKIWTPRWISCTSRQALGNIQDR